MSKLISDCLQKYSNKLKNLIYLMYEDWYGEEIEDDGVVTSQEYLQFQNQYKNVLFFIAEETGYELYGFYGNHYDFSAILKDVDAEKYVYVSISDVRYWLNEWADHILYRTMTHPHDFTGGPNMYTTLKELPGNLEKMKR